MSATEKPRRRERPPLRLLIVPGAWSSPLELRLPWPLLRKLAWGGGFAVAIFFAMGGLSAFSGAQLAKWRIALSENRELKHRNQQLESEVAKHERRLEAAEAQVRHLADLARVKPSALTPAGGETVTGASPAQAEAAYPPPPDETLERAGYLSRKLMNFSNALPIVEAALVQRQKLLDGRPSGTPVITGHETNGFGHRMDPFSGEPGFHEGVDLAAPAGAWVRATGDGIVTFAGWKTGFGQVIEVTHYGAFITRYAHLSTIRAPEGTRVARGQVIGLVGSTGRSTGPHCHYEVEHNGRRENPVRYFGPPEL